MNVKVLNGKTTDILNRFFEVEEKIYKEDCNRIWDDKDEIRRILKRYSDKDSTLIVIIDENNEAIARCCVMIDPMSKEKKKQAMFCYFECIDSDDIAKELFKNIDEWCHKRDVYKIMGPMTDDITSNRGLLLSGEGKPVFCMPYNPTYYDRLLQNCGCKIAKKMLEFIVTVKPPYERIEKASKFILKKIPGIKYRRINLEELDIDIRKISELYNKAWVNNWGFREMIWEDFYNAAYPLRDLLKYSSMVFIEDKLIGFQVIVPDLNYCYKNREYDYSLLDEIKEYRALFIGVDPNYRMIGVDAIMYNEILNIVSKEEKIEKFHVGWVQEDNYKMVQQIKNLGGKDNIEYKYYSLYERRGA